MSDLVERHVWVSCGNGGECDACKCAHDERAPATCPGPPTIERNSTVQFLQQVARYFEKRPTGGEDQAHWANVFNADGCRKAATRITELESWKAAEEVHHQYLTRRVAELEQQLAARDGEIRQMKVNTASHCTNHGPCYAIASGAYRSNADE